MHQKGKKIITVHTVTANLKVSLPSVRLLHIISFSAATKMSTVAKTNQNQDLGPICPVCMTKVKWSHIQKVMKNSKISLLLFAVVFTGEQDVGKTMDGLR